MRLKNRILPSLLAFILLIGCIGITIGFSNTTVYADTTPEGYELFEGSLSTATETQTYNVTVDFSLYSSAGFCLVKTGRANIKAVVKDASGNTVTTLSTWGTQSSSGNALSKSWYIYNGASGSTTFNITVSSTDFDTNSSYRVIVGNGNAVEAMLSGAENAAILSTYVDSKGNYYYGNYIPNSQESYFKFTPQYSTTVITLLSDYRQLRFKIIDPVSLFVVYDSNNDTTAARTTYTNPYSCAQKARLSTLTLGKEYYIVLYTPTALQSSVSLLQGYFNLSVGQAQMLSGSATFYSGSSITGTSTAFSPTAVITTSNVPTTAVATQISLRSLTSGIYMSKIYAWRAKRSDSSTWMTSSSYYPSITVPYSYGSSSNIRVLGNWNFSFKAASGSLTFQPGIYFNYNYEMGD